MAHFHLAPLNFLSVRYTDFRMRKFIDNYSRLPLDPCYDAKRFPRPSNFSFVSIMRLFSHTRARVFLAVSFLICLCAWLPTARAQQPQTDTQAADDVIRINTELIQTDVMVFDRQGRFVNDLKPEQFELRVDGKPMQVSFFERVMAGSVNEEAQIAAARGGGANPAALKDSNVKPLDRGRIFFFFVDDLHQSIESMKKTQQLLLNFIDKEMGQNDSMAVASATGQIGFLQQLTDRKSVV